MGHSIYAHLLCHHSLELESPTPHTSWNLDTTRYTTHTLPSTHHHHTFPSTMSTSETSPPTSDTGISTPVSDTESTSSSSDTENTPPASDTETSPPASDKRYYVRFNLMLPWSTYDTNTALEWSATVVLRGVDSAFLEKGLFWTTQNFVLLGGHLRSSKSVAMWKGADWEWGQDMVRTWELREFPGRPLAESRWTGEINLCAESAQTLARFHLEQLTRQIICRVWVTENSTRNEVLHFNPEDPAANKNELFDSHPSDLRRLSPMESIITDLWRLWPMESIVPKEGGESSSPPQTGDGEEKRTPEGRVTDARVSWPDVAVLLCAAPTLSILAAGWAILVALAMASTLVPEFVWHKGESEPVCHATEDRTSWTDVVVRLFAGLAESFQAVEWPSWKDLVIGAVVSVWGVGGFALLANEVLHNRFQFTWPSWEGFFGGVAWKDFVWGVVVGTWGIGCFVLLADEVLNNRSGFIKLLLGRSWPSWSNVIIGVVMGVWGIGLFVLLTREVWHDGWGFVAGIFRGVGLGDFVGWSVFGTWGIGSFGLFATWIVRNVL